MPDNNSFLSEGTAIGYQNPVTPVVELDSEMLGIDPDTGLQLSREFVIPQNSISGQSDTDGMVPVLAAILKEIQIIRMLLEAGAVPGTLDETQDLGDNFEIDSPDTENIEES